MKKLLTILLSILSLTIMAQVPQGVGYQGVATDANGIELVNQAISIRASVLSGSATGTIEWEETHATSTDTFGLFTLTIGQGTNTTNGAQTSFADISWGTNTHFLKIEMDVTGGSNYSFMGTNQMMSVPYALYAESANINYDSISNLLSNDSTFITNVGGGMGGGGCHFLYPDGFNGIAVSEEILPGGSYTVPAGKRLYMLTWRTNDPVVNGVTLEFQYGTGAYPVIINSGESLTSNGSASASSFTGFFVDENVEVSPITQQVSQNNPYIVPTGKRLYILSWKEAVPVIDGITHKMRSGIPLILNSGQSLSSLYTGFLSNINGYLVDENYFAGCGGGGGSSSTSINYDSLANIISMDSTFITTIGSGIGGGGCDFDYPDGFDNMQVIHHSFTTSPYVVPTGKNLYIRQFFDDSPGQITVNGETVYYAGGFTNSQPNLIFSEGDILDALSGNPYFYGFIVDKEVDALQHLFSVQNPYTVPTGKNLFVRLLANNQSSNIFKVNGQTLINTDFNPLLILNPDDEIEVFGNNTINQIIYGYLADENYFANCGGGSSSGSSASNATIDSLSQVVSNLDSLLNSLFGCTDATACNYNPLATYDNGLCSGFLGCTNPTAINYNPTATCDDNSCVTGNESIGDLFQGGIIFYLDGNGGGLIAAPSDQTSAKWGCYGTSILETEFGIGTGYQNTNAILFPSWCISQSISANFIAADICANLSLGGYSDWFLASKDELNQMYLNKAAIGGFINGDYWSSSEDDGTKAWRQDFGNGSTSGVVLAPSKNATLNVRAIRAF